MKNKNAWNPHRRVAIVVACAAAITAIVAGCADSSPQAEPAPAVATSAAAERQAAGTYLHTPCITAGPRASQVFISDAVARTTSTITTGGQWCAVGQTDPNLTAVAIVDGKAVSFQLQFRDGYMKGDPSLWLTGDGLSGDVLITNSRAPVMETFPPLPLKVEHPPLEPHGSRYLFTVGY